MGGLLIPFSVFTKTVLTRPSELGSVLVKLDKNLKRLLSID